MIAAALLRLAAIGATSVAPLLLQLAAACWMAAFGLYLWRFAPLLIRPRIKEPAPLPTVKRSINIAPR